MLALTKMIIMEAKLFSRERMSLFFGLVFPALLLLMVGLFFPGARDAGDDPAGVRLIDLWAPIALGFALATSGVANMPVFLGTYRERGVLRRLSTTPMSPWLLVTAQLVVHLTVAVLAAGLALGVGEVVFDIPLPQNLGAFVLVYILGAMSMLAIGFLIGAVARTASSAQGIGMAVYFPLLFLAGVYFPREVMPDGLRTVSDMSPSGATVEAIQDTWAGVAPAPSGLLVMAGFALGAGFLAVRAFRWE